MKELRAAPFIQEQILVTVVVVVPPDGPHRDTRLPCVHAGDAHLHRHVPEGAVAQVAVEGVVAPLAAVGDVEVLPAVPVEVRNRDGRPQRSNLRHDMVEPPVETGSSVSEIDAGGPGDFLKVEAVAQHGLLGLGFRTGVFALSGEVSHDKRRGEQKKEEDGERALGQATLHRSPGCGISTSRKCSGVT